MKASSGKCIPWSRLGALERLPVAAAGLGGLAWLGRRGAFQALCGRLVRLGAACALGLAGLLALAGCQSQSQPAGLHSPNHFSSPPPASEHTNRLSKLSQPQLPPGTPANLLPGGTNADALVLREADTVRISFPGSPSLNTVQQIRRDGKLSLPMVGEVMAAGLTPAQLEKQLMQLYAPQLVDKEVTVTLESSAFEVFVTGAVARPGRLVSDRPLTALEAVIDAGVDYQKANLKAVTVIRQEKGRQKVQVLNLQKALQGGGGQPFYLKPSDIIFVRERFTWF